MSQSREDAFEERLEALMPPESAGRTHAPLVLAYVGDAVYELAVRCYLASRSQAPVSELHHRAAQIVRASAQAEALSALEDLLTPEEQDVVRRARNTKANVPKSASLYEYRYSTAFEALVGHLFLTGQLERLNYLLKRVIATGEADA